MFCIYWMEDDTPKSEIKSELTEALKLSEEKRKAGFHFVSICSELPDSVTKMGVDITGPDYDWKKRRK